MNTDRTTSVGVLKWDLSLSDEETIKRLMKSDVVSLDHKIAKISNLLGIEESAFRFWLQRVYVLNNNIMCLLIVQPTTLVEKKDFSHAHFQQALDAVSIFGLFEEKNKVMQFESINDSRWHYIDSVFEANILH